MATSLNRSFVADAAATTTTSLIDAGVLREGERIELTDDGGVPGKRHRLTLVSDAENYRHQLLAESNLRRTLDGIETLRALAHVIAHRLPEGAA